MPITFTESDQYPALNVGAHRRPAPLLGQPALVWHQAFWQPKHMTSERWRKSVDYFLLHLYNQARVLSQRAKGDALDEQRFICPNLDDHSRRINLFRHWASVSSRDGIVDEEGFVLTPLTPDQRLTRYEIFSVRFLFEGLFLTVRADLYREYWTLTIILDLDRVTGDFNGPSRGLISFVDSLQGAITSRIDRNIVADKTGQQINDLDQFEAGLREEIKDRLVIGFRSLVQNRYLAYALEAYCQDKTQSAGDLGGRFAEFFGSIFGLNTKSNDGSFRFVQTNHRLPKEMRQSIYRQIGEYQLAASDALRIVDGFWPFTRALHRCETTELEEEKFGKPEFTVCRLQDERSIYISSLGRLNPRLLGRTYEPVIFTLITTYSSRWQTGRVVERILHAGTLRLAALWDIDKLQDAFNRLRPLRAEVDEAVARSRDHSAVERHHQELGEIATSVDSGGLRYRVERSQYYVRQFENTEKALRISRVEGFQTYGEFVRRRLYGTFDFISRIGDLYTDLRSEIDFQLQKLQADTALQAQKDTRDLIKELQNVSSNALDIQRRQIDTLSKLDSVAEDLRKTAHLLDGRQKKANFLLDNAEKIILLPLIYYFGKIIIDLKGGALAYWAAYSASILIVVVILIFLKSRGERQKRRE